MRRRFSTICIELSIIFLLIVVPVSCAGFEGLGTLSNGQNELDLSKWSVSRDTYYSLATLETRPVLNAISSDGSIFVFYGNKDIYSMKYDPVGYQRLDLIYGFPTTYKPFQKGSDYAYYAATQVTNPQNINAYELIDQSYQNANEVVSSGYVEYNPNQGKSAYLFIKTHLFNKLQGSYWQVDEAYGYLAPAGQEGIALSVLRQLKDLAQSSNIQNSLSTQPSFNILPAASPTAISNSGLQSNGFDEYFDTLQRNSEAVDTSIGKFSDAILGED